MKEQNVFEFILLNKYEILEQTMEHIGLTLISLAFSILLAVPLGILITRIKKARDITLGFVGIIQTIPSIALLGFLIPLVGIGPVPAIIALFLYALLPIARNTCTGIEEVDISVKEAAKGMGMSDLQILTKIELPLATPVIFAGIRTASVLNVAIATVCAYIAAGGLGEYIFRGIALNNTNMILAGAIPAALLAVSLDLSLGFLQRYINKIIKPILIMSILLFLGSPLLFILPNLKPAFVAGFVPEFMGRYDGYKGLKKIYGLKFKVKELDSQLMFNALVEKKVDLISVNSTDGRIVQYDLKILEDDKKLFPPYHACPVVNGDTLRRYPYLKDIFSKIAGKITNEKMARLNFEAEQNKKLPKDIARQLLKELGFKTAIERKGKPNIIIASKNFTEQYILAEIFSVLVENYSNLNVEVKKGLAGTKICFDALKKGEIDIYPEYTGTALYVVLKDSKDNVAMLGNNPFAVYSYVKEKSKKHFNIEWLQPLGFNNTWALVMRNVDAKKYGVESISDLKDFLERK